MKTQGFPSHRTEGAAGIIASLSPAVKQKSGGVGLQGDAS